MRRRSFAWPFAGLLLFALRAAVFAAEPAAAPPPTAAKPPRPVSASLFTSYSLYRGNSEGWSLATQARLSVIRQAYSLQAAFERYYGKNHDLVSVNRGKAGLTWSRALRKTLNVTASAAWDNDRLIALRSRVNLGAGMGYENRRRPERVFTLTANLLYEVAAYDRATTIDARSFRLLLRSGVRLVPHERVNVETALRWNSSLRELGDDYRLEFDASFRTMMVGPLWIKVSFQDRYNHRVVDPTIQRNDYVLLTGLEVSI